MKWVRCPSCRTVNDIERYAMCDGCNRGLAGEPPLESQPSATPVQAGDRDSRSGGGILWTIALLLLLGTVALPPGVTFMTGCLSFLMLASLLANLGLRRVRRAGVGALARIAGSLLAIVAGVGGAVLLVAVACSANLASATFRG
jgi:hypothetical protein